jgi:predicted nuclease of predicted toxin-antitoxin system
VRFLADMGVAPRVVEWLRSTAHDASHLRDEGLQRLQDRAIFDKAVVESRVILTFDLDFGEIVALAVGRRVGVVVFRLRNARPENQIARLRSVLPQAGPALERGAIVVIEESRHRVRHFLPRG